MAFVDCVLNLTLIFLLFGPLVLPVYVGLRRAGEAMILASYYKQWDLVGIRSPIFVIQSIFERKAKNKFTNSSLNLEAKRKAGCSMDRKSER